MTRNRLCVTSAPRAIFRRTSIAHREFPHRRLRPVVRQLADDTVARPARSAADKRITVASVGGIVKLAVTCFTHRQIGWNERCLPRHGGNFTAFHNVKPTELLFLNGRLIHAENKSTIRRFASKPPGETANLFFLTGNADFYNSAAISYITGNAGLFGEAGDKGPVTDPLNNSVNRKKNGHCSSRLKPVSTLQPSASAHQRLVWAVQQTLAQPLLAALLLPVSTEQQPESLALQKHP